MINWTLYRQGLKSNYKTLLLFMLVLSLYFLSIIWMFDPTLGKALQQMAKAMPEMMAMFGMDDAGSTLTSFLSTYLYGMLMLVLPLLFTIILANRLVSRHVDQGSMVFLLAAPVSRKTVALTQLCVLLTCLVSLIAFCTVIGIIASEVLYPGELDIAAFIRVNAGVLCLHFFIGGLCFFTSCFFNETRTNLGVCSGVAIVSYLFQMLANMGDKLELLKYMTFFTLFDSNGLLAGDTGAYIMASVLFAAGAVLYTVSVNIFDKRDLPI